MTPVFWMVAGSLASCTAALALLRGGAGSEVFLGMLAPLAAAVGTWVAVDRAWRRDPASVTGLMVKAFAVKVLFFGAYVVLMLGVFTLRPVPFITSFTTYFILLYFVEALFFSRLFSGRTRRAS
jgi:hypothetical protein